MNEQLMNIQIWRQKLADYDREMQQISDLARQYMNATPEQRARVNINDLRTVLERYNMLKQDKNILQQEVVANEMAYQRALQDAQAQAQNTPRQSRRVVTPKTTVVPTKQWIGETVWLGNATEVDFVDSVPWNTVTINPTPEEQFRIGEMVNWHYYEYGDNGSIKIDWVLQPRNQSNTLSWFKWPDYSVGPYRLNNYNLNSEYGKGPYQWYSRNNNNWAWTVVTGQSMTEPSFNRGTFTWGNAVQEAYWLTNPWSFRFDRYGNFYEMQPNWKVTVTNRNWKVIN